MGVTANVIQEDRKKYLASGMDALVLKPFLEQELLEKSWIYSQITNKFYQRRFGNKD